MSLVNPLVLTLLHQTPEITGLGTSLLNTSTSPFFALNISQTAQHGLADVCKVLTQKITTNIMVPRI